MFYVLLLYALFASIFTVSKQALTYASPFFLVGTRMCIAGVIMLIFQYIKDKESFKKMSLRAWWRTARLAFFSIYLTNVCEFWGLQYLTSFKTCFIYSLSPFVSAFLSYLIFSEKMNIKKWSGLLIGFLGFIPVLASQTTEEEAAGQLWLFSWPEVAVIIAAVASVYGWILLKQLVKEDELTPFIANGFSMVVGGSVATLHSLYTESWNPVPVTEYLPVIQCTLFLIIVSNCICYNLYGFLLQRFSATFMAVAGLTTALFSALFGWFFHGEEITLSFYISLIIVSSGLFIFYQEELLQESFFKERRPTAPT